MIRNRFFLNNSGNPEQIRTKFYSDGGAYGTFSWKLWATKMAQKKIELFCQGYSASEMPFLSGPFV